MRLGTIILSVLLPLAATFAGENNANRYVMNFDLIIKKPDSGEVYYNVQRQGVHLLAKKPLHGDDLGEIDYFLTVSGLENEKGKLTIEVYEFETRKKESDVICEIIADVDFALGSPTRFEETNERFGVDLAFSIEQE